MKISIYSDYEDLCLPEHESKSIGRINDDPWAEWDRSDVKRGELRNEIERFIEKRVGKQFNDIFSEFCRKYPVEKFGYNTRTMFKDEFTTGTYRDRYKAFCVVDGIVRENITPKHKRNNCLLKPSYLWKKIHEPNKEHILFYYDELCDIFGGGLMWDILYNYSEELFKKFHDKCYESVGTINRLRQMVINRPFNSYCNRNWVTGDWVIGHLFDWKWVDRYFSSRDEMSQYKKSKIKFPSRKKRKLSRKRHNEYWEPRAAYAFYEHNRRKKKLKKNTEESFDIVA